MKSILMLSIMAAALSVGWSSKAEETVPKPKAISTNVFELPPLPYAANALEPYISAKTMSFHYGKHHQGYVDTLNRLLGDKQAGQTLEDVIRENKDAENRKIFNNAAQVWNHTFFWGCMKPGGGKPSGAMLERIEAGFGSYERFREAFIAAAMEQFGSGYVWLVQDGKKASIVRTPNAETPLTSAKPPLLACDVWEHAYYLDYQNKRKEFVEAFLDRLVNWEFVQAQVKE